MILLLCGSPMALPLLLHNALTYPRLLPLGSGIRNSLSMRSPLDSKLVAVQTMLNSILMEAQSYRSSSLMKIGGLRFVLMVICDERYHFADMGSLAFFSSIMSGRSILLSELLLFVAGLPERLVSGWSVVVTEDLGATPSYPVGSTSTHAPKEPDVPIGFVAFPPLITPSKSEDVSPVVQEIVPSPHDAIKGNTSSITAPPPIVESQAPSIPHQTGPLSSPPIISPSKPKAAAPLLANSPPSPPTNEHESIGAVSPSPRSPDLGMSPPTVNPPSAQFRNGTPIISEFNGKPPSSSPSKPPNDPAPAPEIFPLSPPDLQPSVPSVVPPMISPPAVKGFNGSSPVISHPPNGSNNMHGPSASHSHSPEGRIAQSPQPVPPISGPSNKVRKGGGDLTPAPASPPSSGHNPGSNHSSSPNFQAPLISPPLLHHPAPIPKEKMNHSPPPVVSPGPLHPLMPFPGNKGRQHAPPPFVEGPKIYLSPRSPPTETPKTKTRDFASPPHVEVPGGNPAPSHHPLPIPNNTKRPYAPPPYADGPVVDMVPSYPPMGVLPKSYRPQHSPSYHQGPYISPVQAPYSTRSGYHSSNTAPSPVAPPERHNLWLVPTPSPSTNFGRTLLPPSRLPIRALPPPPPNLECGSMFCQEPLTNPPPGSPCTCVLPIKVGLRLGVALYTFFPLVSEFAQEIASGIFMKQSQVRIMGANSDNEDPEKTVVIMDLVPLGKSFDNTSVFLTYDKFWHKQVAIQASYFGDYDVLYVLYPGLPPPPPSAPAYGDADGREYGSGNNARAIRPLAVDVRKQKRKLRGSIIAIIVLSSVIAFILVVGAAWLLFSKQREHSNLPEPSSHSLQAPLAKPLGAGIAPVTPRSRPSSTSASISSSLVAYTGAAKTLTLAEIERATNRFDDSRVIGEGGFGRVYCGTLEDGTRVAVKVLKREDQQGGREFLAEVEMLSRLHHRNLVKLIGICTEENVRCLAYELIPNGSVESHLHGNDHISTRVMGTFGYVAPEYAMTGHLLVKSDVYSYGVVLLELLTGRKPVDMTQPPGQENLVSWARPLLTNIDELEMIIDPALGSNYPRESIAKVAAIASMCVQPEVSHRPFMGEVVQALKLVCSESDGSRQSASCSNDDFSMKDNETRIDIGLCRGNETGVSKSDMLYACSRSTEGDDASCSIRMQSSSGPLGTARGRRFWQRVRGLASRSMSEHGYAHKNWSSEHSGRLRLEA
ncbi:Receptor-like serine/threonine-protein kinase ALE2 [Apostasia shenzhenica]|uniref:Receptor-like serine/threonine-protein kinase ALE2 n=1 Tax=Apostasia shenzhenica TaxID=1088818 RepID=A0A2I0ALP0_9ASPA|nr:Receptor-like serine/threonine-protein kinase ALE2 [Apostasia shenzhenica]